MNHIVILILILINFQEKDKINIVLNNLHRYASEANGELYFNLFDENAVFFGTDAKERWTIDQFEDYALKRFDNGDGWTYYPISRNIYLDEENSKLFSIKNYKGVPLHVLHTKNRFSTCIIFIFN